MNSWKSTPYKPCDNQNQCSWDLSTQKKKKRKTDENFTLDTGSEESMNMPMLLDLESAGSTAASFIDRNCSRSCWLELWRQQTSNLIAIWSMYAPRLVVGGTEHSRWSRRASRPFRWPYCIRAPVPGGISSSGWSFPSSPANFFKSICELSGGAQITGLGILFQPNYGYWWLVPGELWRECNQSLVPSPSPSIPLPVFFLSSPLIWESSAAFSSLWYMFPHHLQQQQQGFECSRDQGSHCWSHWKETSAW